MQSTSVPAKFPIPFASSAGGLYTRTIPQASQIGIQDGAASLTDGFPPKCFVPVASGGTPPFGKDFNGLLKQVTQWDQWQQAGGPIVYDSSFQSAIGGYPMGAIIEIVAGGPAFMSTVENNTVAPAVGAAGWMPVTTFGGNTTSISATGTLTANAAGLVLVDASAGNIAITMPAVSSESGVFLPFDFVRTDTSAHTVTLTALGSDVFRPGGTSSVSLPAQSASRFVGDGNAAWRQTNSTAGRLLNVQVFQNPGTFTYTPTPGMNTVIAYVQAAGGGSDGLPATSITQFALSVAGYSGALAVGKFTAAQIGSSQTVAVGAGGSPGASGGGVATAGGNSSFGSLAVANGGPAGNGHYGPTTSSILIVGNAAPVPVATGGNIFNAPGSQGSPSMGAANGSASGNLAAVGGAGGVSPFSAGGPGTGGGGAALVGAQSGTPGNSGLDGIVILYEYS